MAMVVEHMTFYVVMSGSYFYKGTLEYLKDNGVEIVLTKKLSDAKKMSSSVEAKQKAKTIDGRVVEFKSSLLEDN